MPDSDLLKHHPEVIPRRGELIAWLLTGVVILGWVALKMSAVPTAWGLPFFGVFLLLASASISFGNWMDRHTSISLEPDRVIYADGLRKVEMTWNDVREVRVFPSQWGNKVQVFAQTGYFSFRTLGEVVLKGEARGTVGFRNGEALLRQIISNSGLQMVDRPGEGHYYARS